MEQMTCSNCGEPLEAGAAFCGNCGHPIALPPEAATPNQPGEPPAEAKESPPADGTTPPPQAATTTDGSPITQVWSQQAADVPPKTAYQGNLAVAGATGAIPAYAVPLPARQTSTTKASMAVVFAALGIVAGFFIPLLGIGLGVVGLVLASVSHRLVRHRLSLLGIILSILSILVGLASWAYVVAHDPRFSHKPVGSAATKSDGSAVAAQNLITPCYSVNFAVKLNIQNNSGSCNMSAFNGDSLDDSSNAYKVFGTTSAITAASFDALAQQAIESDIHQSLPNFTVTHENAGQFAGSPAYFVTASNGTGVSVMEAAALHTTSNGDNFFVFVHAVNAGQVDLNDLQAGWHWE